MLKWHFCRPQSRIFYLEQDQRTYVTFFVEKETKEKFQFFD